jgi:hypothetical protein
VIGGFSSEMKKQSEAGDWEQAKAKLETEWNGFQTDFKAFVERFGEHLKQQKATFEGVAAAQVKAWQESTQKLRAFSEEMAASRRAQIDTAVQQMKAEASAAEANLQKLAKAGSESWSALSARLAESRAAFDRANQAAWDTFKRARSAG